MADSVGRAGVAEEAPTNLYNIQVCPDTLGNLLPAGKKNHVYCDRAAKIHCKRNLTEFSNRCDMHYVIRKGKGLPLGNSLGWGPKGAWEEEGLLF